jgi:hypothetical protein
MIRAAKIFCAASGRIENAGPFRIMMCKNSLNLDGVKL